MGVQSKAQRMCKGLLAERRKISRMYDLFYWENQLGISQYDEPAAARSYGMPICVLTLRNPTGCRGRPRDNSTV